MCMFEDAMFLCYRARPWNGTGTGTSLLPTADVWNGKCGLQ